MSVSVNRYKNKGLSIVSAVLLVVGTSAFGLMSCGGGGDGGSTPPPVPPVPTAIGYYTGGASVFEEDGSTPLTIEDLQGIFDGTRFTFTSVAKDLIYDGTITSQTGDAFTADVTIYKQTTDLVEPYTAMVAGTITAGSQFNGTFTGTNAGSGTFTLTYALSNSETASLAKVDKTFSALLNPLTTGIAFSIDSNGNISSVLEGADGTTVFWDCNVVAGANSKIAPVASSNIYSVSVELGGPCKVGVAAGIYIGLATTKATTNADDTLVLIATKVPVTGEKNYSLAGDFGP